MPPIDIPAHSCLFAAYPLPLSAQESGAKQYSGHAPPGGWARRAKTVGAASRWQRHSDCGIVVVIDNAGEAVRDARPRQVTALITTSLARERAEALIGIESIVHHAEKAEAMYELLPPDHCPASLERAHR